MVSIDTFRKWALSFPEASEEPHFEKSSFRIKKKIFATYDAVRNRACIKLSENDQAIFSLVDKTAIYPVDNKWGKQGWTFVELSNVREEVVQEALRTAYCEVAPKQLADLIRSDDGELDSSIKQ